MKKSLIFAALLFSAQAHSAQWNTSSIMVLKGDNFEVGPDKSRTELTYENAAGYKYGDTYFFLDVLNPFSKANSESSTEMYAEWHPRLSIGKTTGLIKGDGLIQDVLLANTFEWGNNGFGQGRTNLHGIGFDLKIPKFAFFQVNFYVRDNLDKEGTTTQTTLAYKLPFTVGSLKMDYSAYIDIVHGTEGDEDAGTFTDAHHHSGQQLKLDVGDLYGNAGVFYTGFEYQIWNPKFGIEDGDKEYNLKYFAQWIF
ncbi:MAG: hypothetical protein KC478_12625 [Bacteriovoracaceae bacterium]|nr:hypothetical protein [Bacteriovoracaceae bacterium]